MSIEGTYLNTVKAIYDKITASIILNGEKLKASSLRSGTRLGCPLFTTIIQHSSGSPSYSREEKEMNTDQKRRSKTLTVCR